MQKFVAYLPDGELFDAKYARRPLGPIMIGLTDSALSHRPVRAS
jgi:hypothetical protein